MFRRTFFPSSLACWLRGTRALVLICDNPFRYIWNPCKRLGTCPDSCASYLPPPRVVRTNTKAGAPPLLPHLFFGLCPRPGSARICRSLSEGNRPKFSQQLTIGRRLNRRQGFRQCLPIIMNLLQAPSGFNGSGLKV